MLKFTNTYRYLLIKLVSTKLNLKDNCSLQVTVHCLPYTIRIGAKEMVILLSVQTRKVELFAINVYEKFLLANENKTGKLYLDPHLL